MTFARALGVVVEVIYHQACPVLRKHDVQLGEQAADCAGDGALARQGKEDIRSGIDKVDDQIGSQRRPKALGFGGKEKEV